MNTKLRKKTKTNFGKEYFKLINNSVFGKTMDNVRKHRKIKLAITNWRVLFTYYLLSEPNYQI